MKKTDLMSRINRSQSLNHLAFYSCHKHQNKQCGTKLHKSIFRCLLNLPCQETNSSPTLYAINQWIPNKQNTIELNSYDIGQWRRRWSIDSPHLLYIKHQSSTAICLFQRLSVVKIANLKGTFDYHIIFQGKQRTWYLKPQNIYSLLASSKVCQHQHLAPSWKKSHPSQWAYLPILR